MMVAMLYIVTGILATLGGIAMVLGILWLMATEDKDRRSEEDARDFYSSHGHWPDESAPPRPRAAD